MDLTLDLNLNEILRWLAVHALQLLLGAAILLVIYRIGLSAIRRIIPAVIGAQAEHLPSGSSSADEVRKRITTIEDLLLRLLRLGVLAGFVIVVLAAFDLWTILGAIVLILVAVTFATKDVVLDYVMGFLILIEGPFFKGDYIAVGGQAGVEGTVEEIGLRRTMLRGPTGSAHAVSNGFIRLSSNMTRMFSMVVVDLHVLHVAEVGAALDLAGRVAGELGADPVWADRLAADEPAAVWVTGLDIDGASIRVRRRVQTGHQLAVSGELRRRLAVAFADASIATGRWDTPMPIAGLPTDPG